MAGQRENHGNAAAYRGFLMQHNSKFAAFKRISPNGHFARWLLLVGQTRYALRSSASQHFAAVRGSHSLAEAVLHFTMPLLGLIGTKHMSPSFRDTKFVPPQRGTTLRRYIIAYTGGKSQPLFSVFSGFFSTLVVEKGPKHYILRFGPVFFFHRNAEKS